MCKINICLLLLSLITTCAFSTVTIGNAYWRLSLTAEDDGEHFAGSLTQLAEASYGNKDWCTGSYFLTPRLFGSTLVDCSAYTTPGTIHFTSQSMRSSTGESIPLQTDLEYNLQGPAIHVRYRFTATATVDQAHSIESYSEFAYSAIDGFTNGINDFSFNLGSAQENQGMDTALNQFYIIHSNTSDLVILFPIPFHSQLISARLPGYQNRLQMQFLVSDGPFYNLGGAPYHSILAPGTVIEREFYIMAAPPQSTLADVQHPLVYFSPHPLKADRSIIYMLDELPVPHPNDAGWLYSYDENGNDIPLNGLISLMNRHTESRVTLVTVPDGIWLGMTLVNEGDYFGWAGWHSTNRMKNYAPSDYITWLHDLANHNPAYPWMTRTDLASHGYHHSQSPDNLIDHEFEITGYERAEALFHATHDDLNFIGLSASHIQLAIRFPGFQYVQDALRAGAKYGMRFYDCVREDYHFRLTHEVFPEGEMWGVNTCWWSDFPTSPDWYGYSFPCFQYPLDRGKIALLGGHPEMTFNPSQPQSFEYIEAAFQLIEQYPNLVWVWPIELADRIQRITGIHDFSFNHTNDGYEFRYSGGLAADDTLIVDNIPSNIVTDITVDSMPITDYEYRAGRLYISHCPAGSGEHIIRIPKYSFTPYISSLTMKVYPDPSAGFVKFNALGSRITGVRVKIYALDGTCVDDGSNWEWTIPAPNSWLAQRDLSRLASGIYLYVAECTTVQGKRQVTGKFAILH